jgi:methionine-gamma-lyase
MYPVQEVQDYSIFGEFGDVNPSVTDSSTFTFLNPETMKALFEEEREGCFLYSRHWNPTNKALADALARMEGSEAAQVTASGMGAISAVMLQLCSAGDEIVCSRMVYGGTYALFKHFLPRFGIQTRFVDVQDLEAVKAAITPRTRAIYCEAISNPLLEVANLPELAAIAHEHGAQLVVDNTFSPLIISPIELGADIVVHSLTKFINGTSDCVAGAICASHDLICQLVDVNHGATMLLGPVLDSLRAASILKNLHSLHIRMAQHSRNAQYIAERLDGLGVKVHYPGLHRHPQYALMQEIMHPDFGFGGMLVLDVGEEHAANALMMRMQEAKVGYLAVSLGYFKTLFSSPGNSTSSEIPEEEQDAMGLSRGMIRMSIGLDHDIACTLARIRACMEETGILEKTPAR